MFLSMMKNHALGAGLVLLLLAATTAAEPADPSRITMMWQVQKDSTDADIKLLKSAGINTIQSFALTDWTDEEIKGYLDMAQVQELNVIAYLGKLLDKAGDSDLRCGKSCVEFIDKWKKHPAIFAWHIIDEPKSPKRMMSKALQERAYNTVKGRDPGRPVFLSTNFTSQDDYDKFFSDKAFDIFEMHAYVNPNISDRQRRLIELFKANNRTDCALVITLRAFNGKGWEDIGDNSIQEQYDFFIKNSSLTDNVGFYGWGLSPNLGIKKVLYIRKQFLNLNRPKG